MHRPCRRGLHSTAAVAKRIFKSTEQGVTGSARNTRDVKASEPTWVGKYRNFRFTPLPESVLSSNSLFSPEQRLNEDDEKDLLIEEYNAYEEIQSDLPKRLPPKTPEEKAIYDLNFSSRLTHAEEAELTDVVEARDLLYDEEYTPELDIDPANPQNPISLALNDEDIPNQVTVRHFNTNGMPLHPLDKAKPLAVIKTFGVPRKMLVEFRILPEPFTVIRQTSYDLFEWLKTVSLLPPNPRWNKPSSESSLETTDGPEKLPSLIAPLHPSRQIFEFTSQAYRETQNKTLTRLAFLKTQIDKLVAADEAPEPSSQPLAAAEPEPEVEAQPIPPVASEQLKEENVEEQPTPAAKQDWFQQSGLANLLQESGTVLPEAEPQPQLETEPEGPTVSELLQDLQEHHKLLLQRETSFQRLYDENVENLQEARKAGRFDEADEFKENVQNARVDLNELRQKYSDLREMIQGQDEAALQEFDDNLHQIQEQEAQEAMASQEELQETEMATTTATEEQEQDETMATELMAIDEGELRELSPMQKLVLKLSEPEMHLIWERALPLLAGGASSSSTWDKVVRRLGCDDPQPLLENYRTLPLGVTNEELESMRAGPTSPITPSENPEPTLEESLVEFHDLAEQVKSWNQGRLGTRDLMNDLPNISRAVITGPPGTGKSHFLLQSVEWARKNGWIVIYMPRAQELVNCTQQFVYDLRTRTYFQPRASGFMLQKLLEANAHLISSMKLAQERTLWAAVGRAGEGAVALNAGHIQGIEQGLMDSVTDQAPENFFTFPVGSSLVELINTGIGNHRVAPIIIEWVLEELTTQDSVPTLIAVDSFQSFFANNGKTKYRDPRFARIRSWELSLPRLLLEYAGGKRPINRGAFLGALSSSDTEWNIGPELRDAFLMGDTYGPLIKGRGNVYLGEDVLSEGIDDGLERTGGGMWEKRSSELEGYLHGLTHVPVPGKMNITEAQRMYEIWLASGAILGSHHDEKLLSTYSTSNGNPRQFVWKGLLTSLDV